MRGVERAGAPNDPVHFVTFRYRSFSSGEMRYALIAGDSLLQEQSHVLV
jgi:hypothetical protein